MSNLAYIKCGLYPQCTFSECECYTSALLKTNLETIKKNKVVKKEKNKPKYVEGETYEGLGKYLGTQLVYPHGEDYLIREHKFVEPPVDARTAAKVNTVFIRKIRRV
jgi:hypothetical protein